MNVTIHPIETGTALGPLWDHAGFSEKLDQVSANNTPLIVSAHFSAPSGLFKPLSKPTDNEQAQYAEHEQQAKSSAQEKAQAFLKDCVRQISVTTPQELQNTLNAITVRSTDLAHKTFIEFGYGTQERTIAKFCAPESRTILSLLRNFDHANRAFSVDNEIMPDAKVMALPYYFSAAMLPGQRGLNMRPLSNIIMRDFDDVSSSRNPLLNAFQSSNGRAWLGLTLNMQTPSEAVSAACYHNNAQIGAIGYPYITHVRSLKAAVLQAIHNQTESKRFDLDLHIDESQVFAPGNMPLPYLAMAAE